MFYSLLRQPLLHFLVLGALVFALYAWRAEPAAEAAQELAVSSHIVVDRAALLDFMQYQAGAFEPELFAARFDALDAAEKKLLASSYVREEALFREALKLGMDQGDYIIRQRLVQKVEFLLENLAIDAIDPDDAELQTFFAARSADYVVPPVYSFTHIFFDNQQGGADQARARAEAALAELAGTSPEQAAALGDRYPFLQDYEGRTRDFVVNNFSAAFVGELDRLVPDASRWQGPLVSRYGMHLVQLRARAESFIPTLAELRDRVVADFRYEAMLRGREQAEQRVVADYTVTLELE